MRIIRRAPSTQRVRLQTRTPPDAHARRRKSDRRTEIVSCILYLVENGSSCRRTGQAVSDDTRRRCEGRIHALTDTDADADSMMDSARCSRTRTRQWTVVDRRTLGQGPVFGARGQAARCKCGLRGGCGGMDVGGAAKGPR